MKVKAYFEKLDPVDLGRSTIELKEAGIPTAYRLGLVLLRRSTIELKVEALVGIYIPPPGGGRRSTIELKASPPIFLYCSLHHISRRSTIELKGRLSEVLALKWSDMKIYYRIESSKLSIVGLLIGVMIRKIYYRIEREPRVFGARGCDKGEDLL